MTDGLTEFMRRWVFTPEAQVAETGQAKVWKVRTADGQTAAFKLYRRADRGNEVPGFTCCNAGKTGARLSFWERHRMRC